MRASNCLRLLFALALLASGFAGHAARAAVITIVNLDGASEGFNDPTVAAPIGGNPGTTIGAQRLYVFQYAASIWGSLLPSAVEIRVNAQFNPLSCTATSGVLGSTSSVSAWRDFTNAPFPGSWYQVSLANRRFGSDLDPARNDISTTFNSGLGGAACLPAGWYYGVDGNEGTAIELLPVVLHELAHGLGFATTTNGSTGAYLSGFPAAYDHFLYDLTTGLHWNEMTQAQRATSGVNCEKLTWDGPAVVAASPARLGPRPLLRVNAPGAIAGDYPVGLASFGAALSAAGVTGDVVLVDDGLVGGAGGTVNDACETPFVNAGDLAGKIALVDRGLCTFVVKAKNAQDAGAIAVIVADNAAGCPPAGLGGADPTIVIPAVRVTQSDGALLKANLVGQNVTLLVDPSVKAGADAAGRVMMYAPIPYTSGSSISHYDTSCEPNLLMEPAINNDLSSDVDLTLPLFDDIGWFDHAVPALAALSQVDATADGVRIEWLSAMADSRPWTAYRRQEGTDWMSLGAPRSSGDGFLHLEDRNVTPGGRYDYRLGTVDESGAVFTQDVWVNVPSTLTLALEGARPNPARSDLTVDFTLPGPGAAQLDLVDVGGRIVRTMEVGNQGAGRHTVALGRDAGLRSGVYFLRLTHAGKSLTTPVVVVK
jgi:hypothetical protein